jgi:hypothetical protein
MKSEMEHCAQLKVKREQPEGERMPQIIVTAGPKGQDDDGAVMLRERINVSDFESERFAENLVERLGWAVLDAAQEEQQDGPRRGPITGERRDSGERVGTPA